MFEKSKLNRNSEQPDGKQEQVELAGAAVLKNRVLFDKFLDIVDFHLQERFKPIS